MRIAVNVRNLISFLSIKANAEITNQINRGQSQIVAHLVIKLSAYYLSQNFITVFTGLYSEPDESSPHPQTTFL
jgi:hypothetical protein